MSRAVTNAVYFDLANFGLDSVQYKQVRIAPSAQSFPRVNGNTVVGRDYGFRVTDALGRFTNTMETGTYDITFTNRFLATTFQITLPATNCGCLLTAAELTTSGTNLPGNLVAYSQSAADALFAKRTNAFQVLSTNGTPTGLGATNLNIVQGSNTVVKATNANGTVHLQINAAASSGSANAITNNHSVAVSLNTNLNVGGTNGAAFAFVTNDLKVGGGFEAADIGAGAQFVVTGGDGTLTIGGNELTAGPGKVEARLAGPVGFSLWDDTFVGDDALMWKVFGNGNQTNRGSIGIARGALITGPITNVSLTASKIVLSDGNKALASSTLAESDIYQKQFGSAALTNLSSTASNNAVYVSRLDALDGRTLSNSAAFASSIAAVVTNTLQVIAANGSNGLQATATGAVNRITSFIPTSGSNAPLALSAKPDGSLMLWLATNGNAGIGTNGPQETVHVHGALRAGADATHYVAIGKVYRAAISAHGDDLYIDRPNGQSIWFTRNGTGTPDAIINTSGNAGIGTTTPLAKLHISGGHVATETNAFPTFCTNGMTTLWNSNGTVFLVTSRRAGTNQTFTFLAAEP